MQDNRILKRLRVKRNFVVLLFMTGLTSYTKAQGLLDWITDPVGSAGAYVKSQIDSYVSSAASSLWDNMLEGTFQNTLDENASKIAKFEIDSVTYPNKINGYFPQWANSNNPLPSIRQRLAVAPIDYLRYNYKGGRIRDLGKGIIYNRLMWQADSVKNENRITQLSIILCSQAIDSVRALSLNEDGFLQILLEHPSLALVFNSHPELLRLNATWNGLPIVNNAKLLQYWGTIANKEDELLPQKLRPLNYNELKFNTHSANDVMISSPMGEQLGLISGTNKITASSIDLLNLHPMPKTTYMVAKNTYRTDHLGRVVFVEQSSLIKGKSDIKKGKMKAKHIVQLQSGSTQFQPYFLIPVKQQGTESRLNVVSLTKSKQNKQQLKAFEKKIKDISKQNLSASIKHELFYSSTTDSLVPEYILIALDDDNYLLSNVSIIEEPQSVISRLTKKRE